MTQEEYILIEKSKMNFLEKLLRNDPIVYRTSFLNSPTSITKFEKETIIRASKTKKILPILFFVVLIFMTITFIIMLIQNILIPVVFMFSVLLAFFHYNIGRMVFGKMYNYTIKMNNEFLDIGTQKLEWNKISEILTQEIKNIYF